MKLRQPRRKVKMVLSPNELRIIIRDKLQGKSGIQIRLDILQEAVVNQLEALEVHPTIAIDIVKYELKRLIEEGKLLVDATGAIIDHSI